MSNAYGKPGQDMMHEMTEAYWGGVISQKRMSSSALSGLPGSVYNAAHNRAVYQSGVIERMLYDKNGKVLTKEGPDVQSVEWLVFPNRQEPIVVMRLP